MADTTSTVGVQIERSNKYGTEYVTCRAMRREEGKSHPINVSWSDYEDNGCFADLEMNGFVSDWGSRDFIGFEPHFSSVYSIKARRAASMHKVLTKIERQITKEDAREHGDVLAAFCRAIGAKWVVQETGPKSAHRSSLADCSWHFMSVAEGKNALRREIRDAQEAAMEKTAA